MNENTQTWLERCFWFVTPCYPVCRRQLVNRKLPSKKQECIYQVPKLILSVPLLASVGGRECHSARQALWRVFLQMHVGHAGCCSHRRCMAQTLDILDIVRHSILRLGLQCLAMMM